ncbi:cupin fold metalloprotein, WbuC family [Candidatus Woesebacteria bacterium]|nr:cupin fold metalloprotein, WbuC family [Candidatus Woesebacteria bacterium]
MNPEIEERKEFSISLVDSDQIEELFSLAESLPQQRATLTLYRSPDEKTLTEINVILPGSYIRPHKYPDSSRTETSVPLSGSAQLVTFGDNGEISQKELLRVGMVAKVDANTWHTLVAGFHFATFEVKVYPLGDDKKKDEVFAPWAPEEGTDEADIYFENLRQKLGLSEAS